ncbi:MAG: arylsulfatase [Planctomycetota bacterium]
MYTPNTCRSSLITLALAVTVISLSGCLSPYRSTTAQDSKPNIIFILADDLGYGDLGCYGQKNVKTPNLDNMALEGMRFTQHYAGTSVCAPSRCSLITGLHTGHTYVRGNKFIKPEGQLPIPDENITVAEVLKKAGYSTGAVGKWGLGGPGTTGLPNRQGFDDWFGYLCQRQAHTYYPEHLWNNRKKIILKGNQNGKRQQYAHNMFTDYAMDFIRKYKNGTFFLYLPYTIPHGHYEVPNNQPYTDEPWTEDEKNRAAMIARLDRDVGRIIALLKKTNIDQKTLVFFSSDNGGDHKWDKVFSNCRSFKGGKRDLYEGGIRVPLIARWPGKIKSGSISHHVSAFWDFMPTWAELAGIKPPQNTDGISMVPTLLGQTEKQKKHRFLYWEFHSPYKKPKQAVRMGLWKAVRVGRRKPLELYNLKNDISEQNNLTQQHPEIVNKIEQYMKQTRKKSPHWPPFN